MPTVNPEILVWARQTAGLEIDDAVSKLGIRDAHGETAVKRLAALEAGAIAPTRPMLVKMAKQYRRPLLTFYMSGPPRKGDRGQDFRNLPEGFSSVENAFLDSLIRDVRARQSIVRAALQDEEDANPLPFVASQTMQVGISAVVQSIKDILRFDIEYFRARENSEAAFAYLREQVESAGVFVLLIGNLGSHHTAIGLDAFRGFALADEVAPFIVVNDQDAKSAWSFTLLHELGHLLLGQTGVSGARGDAEIERFCNDVASEVLLPTYEVASFPISRSADLATLAEQIGEFANVRNLSSSLVAYRIFRAGRIDFETWQQLSSSFRDLWLSDRLIDRIRGREADGGPNYYVVRRHRIGSGLIRLVRQLMEVGALSTTRAATVLGVRAKNVQLLLETAGQNSRRQGA